MSGAMRHSGRQAGKAMTARMFDMIREQMADDENMMVDTKILYGDGSDIVGTVFGHDVTQDQLDQIVAGENITFPKIEVISDGTITTQTGIRVLGNSAPIPSWTPPAPAVAPATSTANWARWFDGEPVPATSTQYEQEEAGRVAAIAALMLKRDGKNPIRDVALTEVIAELQREQTSAKAAEDRRIRKAQQVLDQKRAEEEREREKVKREWVNRVTDAYDVSPSMVMHPKDYDELYDTNHVAVHPLR